MKLVILASLVLGGAAAAEPLPDPATLPMPDDVKDACVVTRTIRPAGYTSAVEVASGKDGEIARRGLWTLAQGKLKRAPYATANTWTGGRLTSSEVIGGERTTTAYDARGLPTEIRTGDRVVTFAWKVRPVTHARLVTPVREAPTVDLPRWLPFQGTVEITHGTDAPHAYTYDASGVLVDPTCGARGGLPKTCKYPGGHTVTYRWSGTRLAGVLEQPAPDDHHPVIRKSFTYAADGRVVDLLDEESPDGKTWKPTGHTTIEYRCKGTFMTDDDARWPG